MGEMDSVITFRELSTKFLAWSKLHQAERSHEYYEGYVEKYIAHLGDKADDDAEAMKPYQLEEWVDSHPKWSDNYKRGGVVAINRVFNWGTKSGYVATNPIRTAHKPPAQPRKIFMKPEDYDKIYACLKATDPFRDLLVFVWIVGCRPQEARAIEVRHLHLDKGYILFPKEESKGKREPRKIIINDEVREIIRRNMGERTTGYVFLNSRKQPWTKYAICARMSKLSDMIGTRMFLYAARHGYGTRKLKAGHGHLAIAATMGHKDGSMLAKIYSHIDEDDEHLRTVLRD